MPGTELGAEVGVPEGVTRKADEVVTGVGDSVAVVGVTMGAGGGDGDCRAADEGGGEFGTG